jgi:hypothetical protein
MSIQDSMITLTAPNQTQVRLDGSRVLRVRAANPDEAPGHPLTRIDWIGFVFVMEPVDVVARQVAAELPSLCQLALPGGAPVWLDANKTEGPLPTTSWERDPDYGVRSAVMLGGKKLYLSSTPQEVSDAILSVGGHPLPIPDEGSFVANIANALRQWMSPKEKWD